MCILHEKSVQQAVIFVILIFMMHCPFSADRSGLRQAAEAHTLASLDLALASISGDLI